WSRTKAEVPMLHRAYCSASRSSTPARAACATRAVSHAHRPWDHVYLSVLTRRVPALSQQVRTPPWVSSGPCVAHQASTSAVRCVRTSSGSRRSDMPGPALLLETGDALLVEVLAEGVDERVGGRVAPRLDEADDDEGEERADHRSADAHRGDLVRGELLERGLEDEVRQHEHREAHRPGADGRAGPAALERGEHAEQH